MTKMNALASTCLLAVLLTACGGGSNDYASNTPQYVAGTDVPMAATTSASAVVSFAQEQQTKTSDSTDPVVLGNAMLAVDDTAEPAPV